MRFKILFDLTAIRSNVLRRSVIKSSASSKPTERRIKLSRYAGGPSDIWRNCLMCHFSGMTDEALDATQTFCEFEKSGCTYETPGCSQCIFLQRKRYDASMSTGLFFGN